MKYLITSDLHFTDRPRDEYRFGLLSWLHTIAKLHDPDYLFILGDITDQKDNHSSKLVNTIVQDLEELAAVVPIFILMGNHDFINPECPFFKFLDQVPNIEFIREISHFSLEGEDQLLFLPFTRTPTNEWKDINWSEFDYVFMHQTMDGAKASNGMMMDGLSRKIFKGLKGKIISGDIHVPQTIGPVTYVGSPYHVHFGDNFIPRVLLLENDELTEFYFEAGRKITYEITDPEELNTLDFSPDDQLKVRLKLRDSELADWANLKQQVEDICKARGTYLHAVELLKVNRKRLRKSQTKSALGLSSTQVYDLFCKKENIKGSIKAIGASLLE